MDKLDYKILEILDWKARLPLTAIAKAAKSNKDVVAYRINRLHENGIIVRYFPVLDMHKLGYHTSRLYLDLEEMDPKQELEFITFLDQHINAGMIFRMDYPYRYGIVVWVPAIYDTEKIIESIKRQLGRTLIKYNHSLFCTFRQYPKDYLFKTKEHDRQLTLQPSEKVDYDQEDFRILKELAKDARASSAQIARLLKIPQTTVSHKIRLLEKKKVILGYRAEIDIAKLGHINYFLEIYLNDNSVLPKIESWADVNKNVVWLQKIIGTCDIEIEVEVHDRQELETLLNELRGRFKEIRKIVFWSQSYKKLTFLP